MAAKGKKGTRIAKVSARTFTRAITIRNLPEAKSPRITRFLKDELQDLVELPDDFVIVDLDLKGRQIPPPPPPEKTQVPQRCQITTGRGFFDNPCTVELREDAPCTEIGAHTILGQLIVYNPETHKKAGLNLSFGGYISVHGVFMKNVNLQEELFQKSDLAKVTCTNGELEAAFVEYAEQHEVKDTLIKGGKDIERYFAYINGKLVQNHLPELIIGSEGKGFRLTVHPRKIRFRPAPPFDPD